MGKMKLFVFAVIFGSLTALGQRPDPLKDTWRQDGELFTIQISRGNPVRIFVVGREEAKIDPKTTQLTIRRLKPYPGKILTVNKMDDYFAVPGIEDFKDSNEFEVIAISNEKKKSSISISSPTPKKFPRIGKSSARGVNFQIVGLPSAA